MTQVIGITDSTTIIENIGAKRILAADLLTQGTFPFWVFHIEELNSLAVWEGTSTGSSSTTWVGGLGYAVAGTTEVRDTLAPFYAQKFYNFDTSEVEYYNNVEWSTIPPIGGDQSDSLTAEEVKALYESNPNTNVFTNANQSTLASALQDLSTVPVSTQSTTAYTLQASDAGTVVYMDQGSANVLTVPSGVFSVGNVITVIQAGAGTTTLAESGTTINTPETLKLRKQYSIVQLLCVASDVFQLFGDLEVL